MGKIIQTIFGKLDDGKEVEQFTLTNKNGMSVEVIPFSKTIRFFFVFDVIIKTESLKLV
jgi:hypothetical protein